MILSTLENKLTCFILGIYKRLILSNNRKFLIKKANLFSSLIKSILNLIYLNELLIKNIEVSLNLNKDKSIEIKNSFVSTLIKNISDLLKTNEENDEKILALVKFKNDENLFKAINYKKGVIFVSAHYGLWELMAISVKIKYKLDLSVFAQRPTNKEFENLFYNYRKRFNIETYYNEGISSLKKVDELLKNKEYFAFLVDQHGESQNTLVTFFNKKVSFPSVSINFAYKYNIPIVPVYIKRTEDELHEITFLDPIFCSKEEKKISIQKTAQEIYNIFESFILEKPDEWLWTYERFNKIRS